MSCYIPNIKALRLMVSDRKIFQCFPYISKFLNMLPQGRGKFWPQEGHLNKHGTGSLGDDSYQISRF